MADDSLTYRWATPDDQGQGYSDPNAPGAPESVSPSMPSGYVNPNFWGAVGRGAAALGGDISDLAQGLWGMVKTPGEFAEGQYQPGTPEAESAARNFALTFGLPGGAPEESLSAGMRVRGRPRSLGGRRVAPIDEPLPELDTPPPAPGGNRPPASVKRVSPSEGGTLQPGGALYTQYAEKYPEVGPPVEAIDPKTKKPYLAKQLTPEAEAFEAERKRITADMAKRGYTPYFDPAQRYHVDPSNYPPNIDTTQITPVKQATIDAHMAKIGSPEARANLQAAYARGQAMPGTADWYAMGQLENEFIKALGPVAGRQAFRDRFATSMAATTGGADPMGNLLMSSYGNYLRYHGLPYPTAAYEMPFPIGGRYASGNMAQHQKIFDQGGFPALGAANPKRHNFAMDFMGSPTAATMDEQMVSGMTPGVKVPPSNTYGLYEGVLADEASKVGVPPPNFQDVAWAGFKQAKTPGYTRGQPMIDVINESIERTHRLTGMPREEILRRGVINGEIPLYAAGDISSAIASSMAQTQQSGDQEGAGP